MTRTGRLARHAPMPTRPSTRQQARAATWEDVKAEAWHLWAFRCGVHGDFLPWAEMHGHHRLMRSQGGPDTLANCLPVCTGAHEHIHRVGDLAYEMGWLIRSGGDPEQVPVLPAVTT